MSLFVVWFGVMFPLVFSPGPANIVFAASGAQSGFRRSLPLVAGVDCIFILKSVLVGFGLGQILEAFPEAMHFMQVIGSLYLVYLAYKFIKVSAKTSDREGNRWGFVDGLIVQVLNSKGWLMVVLMFALFSDQARSEFGDIGVWLLVIWLAALNISTHLTWVKMGSLLAQVSNNPSYEKALNYLYGGALFVVAAWMLFDNPIWQGLIE